MRLKLSKLALDDLMHIHDYTVEEWGEEQAVKYVGNLWDLLDAICRAPGRWRLRPDIYPDCRAASGGSHLIVYRVRDEFVEVSRILHGAMNFREHMPTNFMTD